MKEQNFLRGLKKATIADAILEMLQGVDVFERDFRWHGNPPGKGPEDRVSKKDQVETALKKLRTLAGTIQAADID